MRSGQPQSVESRLRIAIAQRERHRLQRHELERLRRERPDAPAATALREVLREDDQSGA